MRDGTLVLAALRDAERIISAGWGYRHGDGFLFHAFAYDPDFAKYSPSRLYLECLIKHCMATGVKEFDFMPVKRLSRAAGPRITSVPCPTLEHWVGGERLCLPWHH